MCAHADVTRCSEHDETGSGRGGSHSSAEGLSSKEGDSHVERSVVGGSRRAGSVGDCRVHRRRDRWLVSPQRGEASRPLRLQEGQGRRVNSEFPPTELWEASGESKTGVDAESISYSRHKPGPPQASSGGRARASRGPVLASMRRPPHPRPTPAKCGWRRRGRRR